MAAARITKVTPLGPDGPDGPEFDLEFIGGSEEAEPRSEAHQREIQQVADLLKDRGLDASPIWSLQKALPGGSWLTGEFLVPLAQAAVPALGVVLVGWLQGRAGRKVRVKFGDTEAEARTPEDLKRVLELVEEHKAKASGGTKEGQP